MFSNDSSAKFNRCLNSIKNRSSESVNLSFSGITDQLMLVLANAFVPNNAIRSLNLHFNQITDQGVVHIASLLTVDTKLEELILSQNYIETDGALELVNALKVNKSLKTLNMCGNKIKDAGAKAFGEYLRENETLLSLNLDTGLSYDGALEITDHLKINSSLKYLKLSVETMEYELGKSITDFLMVNRSLTSLDLSFEIREDRASKLVYALKVNETLADLSLCSNNIVCGLDSIADVLKVNKTLLYFRTGVFYSEIEERLEKRREGVKELATKWIEYKSRGVVLAEDDIRKMLTYKNAIHYALNSDKDKFKSIKNAEYASTFLSDLASITQIDSVTYYFILYGIAYGNRDNSDIGFFISMPKDIIQGVFQRLKLCFYSDDESIPRFI